MLSCKVHPGNSGKSHRERRRFIILVTLILTLSFPQNLIVQSLYSSENNYDFSSPELIQGFVDEELTPLASNKFQKSIIQFTLFTLNTYSQNFIHTYQLKTTYHDRPMKVILRL